MDLKPQIFTAKVMHKRTFPKENAFTYGIYYLTLPVKGLEENKAVPKKKFAPLSFKTSDHGARDDTNLEKWIRDILKQYKIDQDVENIMLIAMPRILGYVFNPVSFWICLNKKGEIRAVLCEVNNTFGETHSYLCAHPDGRPITKEDWLKAEKVFHVSPFLKREGEYKFRFALNGDKLGIWIDLYTPDGEKQLLTSLVGKMTPLNKQTLRKAFWSHPLVTFKAITLIHWQAVKLIAKGIKHIKKPKQNEKKLTTTNLTKF